MADSKEQPLTDGVPRCYKSALLDALNRHAFLNVTVLCTSIQADVLSFQSLCKGDIAAASRLLALSSGLAGATEFILNPTCGKLSDEYGRKVFLLLGCGYAALGNFLVFLYPQNYFLNVINRSLTWSLLTVSGSVTGSAAISDLCQGSEYAINMGKYFSAFGIGVVIGPAIGGWILNNYSYRYVYLVRSIIALFEFVHDWINLKETLPENLRRPFAGIENPFNFIKLFSGPSSLVKLISIAFISSIVEGKNTNDIFQMWIKQDVKLSLGNANIVTIAFGVLMFSSGKFVVPELVKRLGPRGFTTFAFCSNFLAYSLWASKPSLARLITGMLLLWPGINANCNLAIKGMATDHAVAAGYGKGEYAGLFNNLRAVTVTSAPIFYGMLYSFCIKKSPPSNPSRYSGIPWIVAASVGSLLPELIHRSMTDADIKVGKKSE